MWGMYKRRDVVRRAQCRPVVKSSMVIDERELWLSNFVCLPHLHNCKTDKWDVRNTFILHQEDKLVSQYSLTGACDDDTAI